MHNKKQIAQMVINQARNASKKIWKHLTQEPNMETDSQTDIADLECKQKLTADLEEIQTFLNDFYKSYPKKTTESITKAQQYESTNTITTYLHPLMEEQVTRIFHKPNKHAAPESVGITWTDMENIWDYVLPLLEKKL